MTVNEAIELLSVLWERHAHIDRYDIDKKYMWTDGNYVEALDMAIKALEQEPKIGHWIEVAKYSDGKHKIECSKCGSHIFDRGHANSYNVKEKYKYCPRCEAKMVKPQESEDKE